MICRFLLIRETWLNHIKPLNVEIYPSYPSGWTLVIHQAELRWLFRGTCTQPLALWGLLNSNIFNINLQFPKIMRIILGRLPNPKSEGRFGVGQVTIASYFSQLMGDSKPAFLSFRASSIETSSVLPSPANFTNFSLARPSKNTLQDATHEKPWKKRGKLNFKMLKKNLQIPFFLKIMSNLPSLERPNLRISGKPGGPKIHFWVYIRRWCSTVGPG